MLLGVLEAGLEVAICVLDTLLKRTPLEETELKDSDSEPEEGRVESAEAVSDFEGTMVEVVIVTSVTVGFDDAGRLWDPEWLLSAAELPPLETLCFDEDLDALEV